jgi:hypothetical protein
MKALTVRQPWAWLLFHGKPVENRDWYTTYRGPLAIHAAKTMTRAEYEDAVEFVTLFDSELARRIPPPSSLVFGAVIGTVEQIACVRHHPSPFFQGDYGHVYAHAKEFLQPIPTRGALGLWDWEMPA